MASKAPARQALKRLVMTALIAGGSSACSRSEPSVEGRSKPENAKEASGAGFYTAVFGEPNFPTPDTGSEGQFRVEQGCLVFISVQGSRFIPVFPSETEFQSVVDGPWIAIVNGKKVTLNRSHDVKGGEGQYAITPAPAGCPDRQFHVGDVR